MSSRLNGTLVIVRYKTLNFTLNYADYLLRQFYKVIGESATKL